MAPRPSSGPTCEAAGVQAKPESPQRLSRLLLVKPACTLAIVFQGLLRNAKLFSAHVVAEEIEAIVDSSDEGFSRVLLEPETCEHLVHQLDGPADLPTRLGKDRNVVHVANEEEAVPLQLEIEDESHRHAGHVGARPEGETHFSVTITSAAFAGETRVSRQRLVYQTLAEELATRVHALSLTTLAPDEDRR